MMKKIILADDEQRWRMLVHDYLEQEECDVWKPPMGPRP